MKNSILTIVSLLFAVFSIAQQKISLDIGAIQNTHLKIFGTNASAFYHFSEKISVGVELNRFFAAHTKVMEEHIKTSAWDWDFNMHYYLPLAQKVKIYPIVGFSHTAETEKNVLINEEKIEKFWSYNTGAGFALELGKCNPFTEYLFTWGHLKQQFFLIGLSFEFDVKKRKTAK